MVGVLPRLYGHPREWLPALTLSARVLRVVGLRLAGISGQAWLMESGHPSASKTAGVGL